MMKVRVQRPMIPKRSGSAGPVVNPMRGHTRTANANRTLRTESGLNSSRGASRANQDRVFGKSRFLGFPEEPSRSLVTDGRSAPRFQSLQWVAGRAPDSILSLSTDSVSGLTRGSAVRPWTGQW